MSPSLFSKLLESLEKFFLNVFTYTRAHPRIVGFFVFIILIYSLFIRPPSRFEAPQIAQIPQGVSLNAAAKLLKEEGVVSSSWWLQNLVILFGGEHNLVAGDYFFKTAPTSIEVAWRISHGDYGFPVVKLTFPEGFTRFQIADVFDERFYNFKKDEFLTLSLKKEGRLFPETYFFSPSVSAQEVITTMEKMYEKKVGPLRGAIAKFGKSEADVLTMASILEDEALTTIDRRIVAGILWKRLLVGMPLQVDATFAYYVNGKNTHDLTTEDLKIDSPYNTYTRRGLPPGPIDSPGLSAIMDAITPTKTPYFYYLSDKDGVIHYAKTFDEHKANKLKYLGGQ